MKTLRLASRLIFNLLVLFAALGCSSSSGRPVCHPVKGRVTLDKLPVAEAEVVFYPVQGTVVPLPSAQTRSDGHFDVTTWANQDGAPVGEYVVTVVLKQLILQGEEKVRSGKNVLPALYADPKKSPLRCVIKEGENMLQTFELKK